MCDTDNPYGAAERDERSNWQDEGEYEDEWTPNNCSKDELAEAYQDMTTIPMDERDVIRMEVVVDVSEMTEDERVAINQLRKVYEQKFREVASEFPV